MRVLLKGGRIFAQGKFEKQDMLVNDGIISDFFTDHTECNNNFCQFDEVKDISNMVVLSGFVDVHTHLRQPGFSYKETIFSGTSAAAAGGFVAVCSMPNLAPPPDTIQSLKTQLQIIESDAVVPVFPYGCITKGQRGEQIADIEQLAPYVCGFSDDGRGVQDGEMMRKAAQEIAKTGRVLVAHCEQDDLKGGLHIHDGQYAARLGIRGISAESEYVQLARDMEIVAATGVRYHACHLSCRQSVEIIRQAKKAKLPVTCETAPHYLLLCEDDLQDSGNFKMNPPLRTREDRQALLEGIVDGTIDCIATDHAPHSPLEKDKKLLGSLNGIVGLECAFAVLYTKLVGEGVISLDKLMTLLSKNPAQFVGLDCGLKRGNVANFTVVDLQNTYTIDSQKFLSLGKSTPFDKQVVVGKVCHTFCAGREVFDNGKIVKTRQI